MNTAAVYKALVESFKRLGVDTAELGDKIDLAFALGRLTKEEYTELVTAIRPATETKATTKSGK